MPPTKASPTYSSGEIHITLHSPSLALRVTTGEVTRVTARKSPGNSTGGAGDVHRVDKPFPAAPPVAHGRRDKRVTSPGTPGEVAAQRQERVSVSRASPRPVLRERSPRSGGRGSLSHARVEEAHGLKPALAGWSHGRSHVQPRRHLRVYDPGSPWLEAGFSRMEPWEVSRST